MDSDARRFSLPGCWACARAAILFIQIVISSWVDAAEIQLSTSTENPYGPGDTVIVDVILLPDPNAVEGIIVSDLVLSYESDIFTYDAVEIEPAMAYDFGLPNALPLVRSSVQASSGLLQIIVGVPSENALPIGASAILIATVYFKVNVIPPERTDLTATISLVDSPVENFRISKVMLNNDLGANTLASVVDISIDLVTESQLVEFADNNLKAAVNAALGRGSLDDITRTDLLALTTLTARGQGISSLIGLQYAANLTYLDVRDNPVTDISPVSGLPNLNTLLTGSSVSASDREVPTLPEWGMILLACLLMWQLHRQQRENANTLRA